MKTIAISNTISGVKTVVDTEATTLGELKQFMNDNNISYPSDALWYSGLTKARLEFDNSEFLVDNPRTCNINGQEKNVYGVILIVPSKNKIESGVMSRGEIYLYIRENGLAEEIKEAFGKNYTNVPTEDLAEFIASYDDEPADDMDENFHCCCHEPKTPIEVLEFINKALSHTIDIIKERANSFSEKVCTEDDLDKMLRELR